jgi:hypothetical protein
MFIYESINTSGDKCRANDDVAFVRQLACDPHVDVSGDVKRAIATTASVADAGATMSPSSRRIRIGRHGEVFRKKSIENPDRCRNLSLRPII